MGVANQRARRGGVAPILSIFLCTVGSDAAGAERMAFTTSSRDARRLFAQGLDAYDRAHPRQAVPLFDKALQADPRFALASLYRGLSGDSNPHIRKAAELAAGASEAERRLILGWVAQLDSKLAEAVGHAEAAVEQRPAEPRLRLRLAQLYNATDRREEAVTHLREATRADPAFAPAYNFLGAVHIARGDFEQALTAREAYARLLPSEAEPLQALAHTYQQMRRFDRAIEHYTRALAVDPDYINVYRRRGDARFLSGDVTGARADYAAGLQRAKGADRPGLLFATAFTYAEEGRPDDAARYYEQAIAIAEAEKESVMISSGYNALGRTLLESGRLPEASAAYRKGHESAMRAPDFTERDRLLWTGRYHHARGRMLARIGEYDAAMEHAEWIRAALEKHGNPNQNYAESHQYLTGYILLEKGDHAGALAHLKKANTDDVFIKLLMARAHDGLNERDRAEQLMKEVANYGLGSVPASIARREATRWLERKAARP